MPMRDALNRAKPSASPSGRGNWSTAEGRRKLVVALGLAIAVVSAALLAFYRMYSTFPWYDDDGYLLVSLQSFLGGHPLYDDTYSNYGPFYYLWRFLLHGMLGVPVTHDATRVVALFEWGLCGVFAALLLRRGTGDSLFGVAAGLLIFLFLEPVTKEPSHPQLLAMVVTFGAALAFTHNTSRRTATFVTGLLLGALLAIKPNLGMFAGLGLALVRARWVSRGSVLTGAGIAVIVMPIVLLQVGFAEPTVVGYAAMCALAALAQTLDRRPSAAVCTDNRKAPFREASLLLLGAGAAYLGAAGFALCRGTTLAGLFDGVIIRPMKFAGAFTGPAPFRTWTVVPAILAALFALWIGCSKRGHGLAAHGGVGLGIGVLAVASVGYLLTGCKPIDQGGQTRAFADWLLALGTPWAFLLRPSSTGKEPNAEGLQSIRTRETLIALAVTHMPIGFPAAGTQLSCGASVFVLAALASAHDALMDRLGKVKAGGVTVALALLAAALPAYAASATYHTFTSIGLPGASVLRVDYDLATQFRVTTATLRTNGGPFVTVYGVNSLYLWTQMAPPTAANTTVWPWMLNDSEQSAIVAVLERDERSVALVVTGGPYLLHDATNQILGRWILNRTTSALEVGPGKWQLRRRVQGQGARGTGKGFRG